jgi:hypothetical protein
MCSQTSIDYLRLGMLQPRQNRAFFLYAMTTSLAPAPPSPPRRRKSLEISSTQVLVSISIQPFSLSSKFLHQHTVSSDSRFHLLNLALLSFTPTAPILSHLCLSIITKHVSTKVIRTRNIHNAFRESITVTLSSLLPCARGFQYLELGIEHMAFWFSVPSFIRCIAAILPFSITRRHSSRYGHCVAGIYTH